MEILEEYMVTAPLPCVYLVVSSASQFEFHKMIVESGRSHSSSGKDRVYIKVINRDELEISHDKNKDWLYLERDEPTCIMFCRDWQHYEVDDNKNSNINPVLDSSVVNVLPSRVDVEDEQSKIIRGTLKQLEVLVKEDVEKCIGVYRQFMDVKINSKCKILFLILLNENIKDPNKVVSGLKTLNPNEVAAICVTCGLVDISIKLARVEQLMYEISLSYYEKKVKGISKTASNLKYQVQNKPVDFDSLYLAALYFKLGYFSEFLSNTKEAANRYNLCWNLLKQMDFNKHAIDKIALCLFVSMRIIDGYFLSANITNALAFSLDAIKFMTNIFDTHKDLYYKFAYKICFNVAQKLEYLAKNDPKNNIALAQQASHYYKWAIKFIIYKIGLEEQVEVTLLGNILYYLDDDFKHLYRDAVITEQISVEDHCSIEPLVKVGSQRKEDTYTDPHLTDDPGTPPYSDATSESLSEEIIERSPHDEERELPSCSEASDLNEDNVLPEVQEYVIPMGREVILERLQRMAHIMIMKLLKCLGRYNWNNTIIEGYVLLSDSYYITRDYKRALRVYSAICNSVIHSVQLDVEFVDEVKISKEVEFDQLGYLNICLIGEIKNNKNWLSLFLRLLAMIIISISNLLDIPKPPQTIYRVANIREIPVSNAQITRGDEEESAGCEYRAVLIKSLLTMISLLPGDELMCDYLVSLSAIPMMRNLKSFVILNKNHTSQYLSRCQSKTEDGLEMNVDIVISFRLDLPCDIHVSEGFINTSMGLSTFYIGGYSDGASFVLFTNDDSSSSTVVRIPKDRNILLALTLSSNFKFSVRHFKVLGLCLKWQLNELSVFCIIPSMKLYHYDTIVPIDSMLFGKDSSTPLAEHVMSLGLLSGDMVVDDQAAAIVKHTEFDKKIELNDNIMILIYKALEVTTDETNLANDAITNNIKLFKIANSIKVKAFTDDAICNVFTPIIFAISCNRALLPSFYSDFEIVVDLINTNNELYVLTDGNQIKRTSKMIIKLKDFLMYHEKVPLDVVINANDSGAVVPLVYSTNLDDVSTDVQSDKDAYCSAESLPIQHTEIPEHSHVSVISGSKLVESARGDELCDVPDRISLDGIYKTMYESGNAIYLVFGLIKMYKTGQNDNKFNVHCQLKNEHKMYISSYSGDKMLVSTEVVESFVHEQMKIFLRVEDVYNNTIGSKLKFLSIKAQNDTPTNYLINSIQIFNDNRVIAENESFIGYVEGVDGYQHLNLMYTLSPSVGRITGMCTVKIVKSINKSYIYPFNHFRNYIKSTVNGYIDVLDDRDKEISIDVRHRSIVAPGEEFELNVTLYNNSDTTQECNVSLAEVPSLSISEPHSLDASVMPKSSDMLSWYITANECDYHEIPLVTVVRKSLYYETSEIVRSCPSRVFVTPH